jgi:hypothetical protein
MDITLLSSMFFKRNKKRFVGSHFTSSSPARPSGSKAHMVILQSLFTNRNQFVAHVRRESGDVGLLAVQAEFGFHPFICLPFLHKATFPELIENSVRFYTFAAEFFASQSTQRPAGVSMYADI